MLTSAAGNLYHGNSVLCLRFVLCPKIKLYMLVFREPAKNDFHAQFYTSDGDVEQHDLIKDKCVYDADQTR
jgi:hypothetical protein